MDMPKNRVLKKEWNRLKRREIRYLRKRESESVSFLDQKLEAVVPDKLQSTIETAFYKAFELVFEKGAGLIEKSYNKQRHERNHKINAYAYSLERNRQTIRSFSKSAGLAGRKNLVLSGVEGAGLGLLGIGLPDIPVFTGVLLKSIYEMALNYGFSYKDESEKLFILKLIEVSLLRGSRLKSENEVLNNLIEQPEVLQQDRLVLIRNASDALAKELIYMKFLQGIPIVGVVGGLSDLTCLKKILEYADLKYRRRCYVQKLM